VTLSGMSMPRCLREWIKSRQWGSASEREGKTENHALGVVASDFDGYEDCAIPDRTVESDLNVGRVEDEVSDFGQRTVAPEVEFSVEISSKAGDLSRGDIQAAKFFENLGDAASGNALKAHFGDGGLERAVRAGPDSRSGVRKGSVQPRT
jgi:hypothetical protein